jgi:hypothetical protein
MNRRLCKGCGGEAYLLLTSFVCDTCNPPEGSLGKNPCAEITLDNILDAAHAALKVNYRPAYIMGKPNMIPPAGVTVGNYNITAGPTTSYSLPATIPITTTIATKSPLTLRTCESHVNKGDMVFDNMGKFHSIVTSIDYDPVTNKFKFSAKNPNDSSLYIRDEYIEPFIPKGLIAEFDHERLDTYVGHTFYTTGAKLYDEFVKTINPQYPFMQALWFEGLPLVKVLRTATIVYPPPSSSVYDLEVTFNKKTYNRYLPCDAFTSTILTYAYDKI